MSPEHIPSFSPEELKALLMSVGGSRSRPLTPVQVGELLRREHELGATRHQLAETLTLHESTSVLSWFLRLPDLPDEVRALVQFGRPKAGLSLSQAAEVARLSPDDDAMVALARLAIEHRLTSAETRSVVQIVLRRSVDVATAAAEVLQGRPTVERRHVHIGALSPETLASLQAATNDDKTERLSAALRALGVKVLDARAAGARYTLVLDEQQAVELATKMDADELEHRINDQLGGQP